MPKTYIEFSFKRPVDNEHVLHRRLTTTSRVFDALNVSTESAVWYNGYETRDGTVNEIFVFHDPLNVCVFRLYRSSARDTCQSFRVNTSFGLDTVRSVRSYCIHARAIDLSIPHTHE